MRHPALIFDFGNVIAHFDFRRAGATFGEPRGLSGEAWLDHVRALGFDAIQRQYEGGGMDSRTFSAAIIELAGLTIGHEEFADAWSDIFSANESIAPVIAGLKQAGYTLILGSNTNELHATSFRRQFAATLDHFDRLVLSHEVGHLKPSTPFYLACAEAAGTEPGDCVFIDDLPANVEGARGAGLIGILYQGTEGLIADLARVGVVLDQP